MEVNMANSYVCPCCGAEFFISEPINNPHQLTLEQAREMHAEVGDTETEVSPQESSAPDEERP